MGFYSFQKNILLLQHCAGRCTVKSQYKEWHCILCKNYGCTKPWSSVFPNLLEQIAWRGMELESNPQESGRP